MRGRIAISTSARSSRSGAADALTTEFRTRGRPCRYDPRQHAFDGANLIPLNEPSLPIEIRRSSD